MRRLAAAAVAATLALPAVASAQPYVYGNSGAALGQLVLNGSTVVSAFDQGWYNHVGFHDPANENYIVGTYQGETWRDWFAFNVPNIGAITSAALRLDTESIEGVGPTFTVNFFDVLTGLGTLTSGAGGVAAYLDLGTGVGYGSRTYTTADQLQVLDVTLNASAVAALNGAAGGQWAIGGTLGPTSSVPEPGTYALLATGLAGLGAVARRRRRA